MSHQRWLWFLAVSTNNQPQPSSPEEWAAYRNQLKATYQRVLAGLQELADWNQERPIGGALAVLVHTAYHLGEIRQAMCVLKQD